MSHGAAKEELFEVHRDPQSLPPELNPLVSFVINIKRLKRSKPPHATLLAILEHVMLGE